ncbi:MAG: hypothetical protein LQ352_007281 [Teloschistes flavicans]|nr:MAG: hypothetical protein LQ352_007281 [Teloschistes flavicans]
MWDPHPPNSQLHQQTWSRLHDGPMPPTRHGILPGPRRRRQAIEDACVLLQHLFGRTPQQRAHRLRASGHTIRCAARAPSASSRRAAKWGNLITMQMEGVGGDLAKMKRELGDEDALDLASGRVGAQNE